MSMETSADKLTPQQRQNSAMEMRRKGKTLAEIGRALGVNQERARKILIAAERNESLPRWVQGLQIQIARVLVRKGFRSKRAVRAAINRGERIDRLGAVRLAELSVWLNS